MLFVKRTLKVGYVKAAIELKRKYLIGLDIQIKRKKKS